MQSIKKLTRNGWYKPSRNRPYGCYKVGRRQGDVCWFWLPLLSIVISTMNHRIHPVTFTKSAIIDRDEQIWVATLQPASPFATPRKIGKSNPNIIEHIYKVINIQFITCLSFSYFFEICWVLLGSFGFLWGATIRQDEGIHITPSKFDSFGTPPLSDKHGLLENHSLVTCPMDLLDLCS